MTSSKVQADMLAALRELLEEMGRILPMGVCGAQVYRAHAVIAAAEAETAAPAPILAIVLEGGCITDIVSDRPELFTDFDVLTIDYDVEGIEEDSLIAILQPSGGAEFQSEDAFVRDQSVNRAKIDLAAVTAALDARDDAKAEG